MQLKNVGVIVVILLPYTCTQTRNHTHLCCRLCHQWASSVECPPRRRHCCWVFLSPHPAHIFVFYTIVLFLWYATPQRKAARRPTDWHFRSASAPVAVSIALATQANLEVTPESASWLLASQIKQAGSCEDTMRKGELIIMKKAPHFVRRVCSSMLTNVTFWFLRTRPHT